MYARTLVLAALMFGMPALYAEDKCPISGKTVDEEVFLEVNGEDVHFCCEKCVDVYKKKILLVDKGPGTCPISGEKAGKKHSVIERTAERVYFCCDNCPKKFAAKHKFKHVDKGPEKCPVSGAKAKDAEGTSLVVNGEKVYFCCANCPKKYVKKLGVADKEPGKCPISGGTAKKEHSEILVKSKVVYFCCGGCKEKYIAKMYKDGVVVPQAGKKDSGEHKGSSQETHEEHDQG